MLTAQLAVALAVYIKNPEVPAARVAAVEPLSAVFEVLTVSNGAVRTTLVVAAE
jgi:hypothetical protein